MLRIPLAQRFREMDMLSMGVAGIQKISGLPPKLDPRFHEDDDFCRSLVVENLRIIPKKRIN